MNKKEILESNFRTISNCDSKATSLLTAVGIIFSFSMFSISDLLNKQGVIFVFVCIFGAIYVCIFAAIISILIMIIFPRGRTKKEKANKIDYQLYSEDLFYHLKNNDIESFINSDVTEEGLIDQIKVCTRIAHQKENLLMAASLLAILFAVALVAIIILLFL